MIIKVNTFNIVNPNRLGETLREWAFIPKGYLGGYNTFKLRFGFKPIPFESASGSRILSHLFPQTSPDFYRDEQTKIGMFSNGIVHVAWHKSPKGTRLIFIEGKRCISTDDSKETQKWVFHS